MRKELVQAIWPIVERARKEAIAIKKDGESRWTDRVLDVELLLAHVSNGPAIGVCYIPRGGDTTSVAVLDLDSHKGETSWDEMVACARKIVETMTVIYGMRPRVWRSSGGEGLHIYVVWENPQDAYTVRKNMRDMLAMVGLKDGTGGVAKGQVEVFPKQDSVGVDKYGNQTILPLTGLSAPVDIRSGLVFAREAAIGMEWPTSVPLPFLSKPDRSNVEIRPSVELEKLQRVLMSIPNDGESEMCPAGYDEYRDILFAVHAATEGSAEGLELFIDWSSQNPLHNQDANAENMWLKADAKRAGGIGFGTLMRKALERGYRPSNADGFVDVHSAGASALVSSDTPVVGPPVAVAKMALPPFVRNKEGTILAHARNLLMALRRPDFIKWRIAFDEFCDELVVDPGGTGQWRSFCDSDLMRLREFLPNTGFAEVGKELLRDAVDLVADENKMDTAKHWLEKIVPVWDGVPRIATFFERFFSVVPGDYAKAVAIYLWTAMAGRVLEPGCQADMTPVLVGAQGERKTSALAAMVPSREHLVEIDFNSKDDDLVRMMRGALVAEIGELRGFNKKEQASIKAFMTRRHDKWVPKFKEHTRQYRRRVVFIGTTNEDRFLLDPTGNRRWLPLNVGSVNVEGIREAMLQLWAEGRDKFLEEGVAWREAERLGRAEHEQFEIRDPWLDTVARWLDSTDIEGRPVRERSYLTTEMVLAEAMDIPPGRRDRWNQMRAGQALRKIGGVKKKIRTASGFDNAYVFPPVPT